MDYNTNKSKSRLSNLSGKSESHPPPHVHKGKNFDSDLIRTVPATLSIEPAEDLYQRFVVFQRDEQGYGLTVSGDNPVFVQSVKEDGPAAAAGVQKGDRILRVNDFVVTQSNHSEVVRRIKSGTYVALTLLGKAPAGMDHFAGKPPSTGSSINTSSNNHAPTAGTEFNNEQQHQSFIDTRLHTMNTMREKEMQHIIQLTKEYESNPTEKLQNELDATIKRIKHLQEQIMVLTMRQAGMSHDSPSLLVNRPLPPAPVDVPSAGRISRKNSGGSGSHVRQLSTPEPLHIAAASRLAEPADLSQLNRSLDNITAVQPEELIVDATGSLPPIPGRIQTGTRLRTSSLSEGTLRSVSPVAPPLPPPLARGSGSFGLSDAAARNGSGANTNQQSFMQFGMLSRHLPYLSVFLHHLIAESNPAPTLFHVLTDFYLKGTPKELQRWMYEIYSIFIAPNSPLELEVLRASPEVVECVELVMDKSEKDDNMIRDIFNTARNKALEVAKKDWIEFQQKRAQNSAAASGPSDSELDQAVFSTEKSREIADDVLKKDLEVMTGAEEPENRCDKQAALGCALASLLKNHSIKVKDKDGNSLVEKWPVIVQKDKNRFKPKDKSKKLSTNGHQYAPFNVTTSGSICAQCGTMLWGPAPQGYDCTNCELVFHRNCVKSYSSHCTGKKPKPASLSAKDSFPKFLDFRKKSNMNPTAIAAAKKIHDEKELPPHLFPTVSDIPETDFAVMSPLSGKFDRASPQSPDMSDTFKTPINIAINRSESLKGHKKQAEKYGNRKKSDPTQLERNAKDSNRSSLGISESSSSSHSLHSSESPTVSVETLGSLDGDSDFEADPDVIPSWHNLVSDPAIIEKLDDRVRKRQDVLAELFHTERTHVRNLKILYNVFYGPMLKEHLLPPELQHEVFANLEEMIDLHSELNKQMRRMRKSNPLIGNVGDLLLSRFDGTAGHKFKLAAAAFCRNQSVGLEALKGRIKKDQRLAHFLQEAESNPLCRRLQLKDIIPTGMQRLTKYPLLIENLLKYTLNTPDDHREYDKLSVVLKDCKDILDYVNQAARDSANTNRLRELQDRIDMAPFKKTLHKIGSDVKDLDMTHYRLLFESDLTWRISKQKSIDLRVVLLDHLIVLVSKVDDKLVLRFHNNPNANSAAEKRASTLENNRYWSPILSLEGLIVRDVATDPRAFFMFSTTETGAQMYEMVASSANEEKTWKQHIMNAVDRVSKYYATIPENFPVTATASVTAAPEEPNGVLSGESEDEVLTSGISEGAELSEAMMREKSQKRKRIMSLASPSAVIVTQTDALEAEVVLTPFEQLRRRDAQLEEALTDKKQLVCDILGIDDDFTDPPDEFEEDFEKTENADFDAKALVLHSMRQTTHLMNLVTDALTSSNEALFEQLKNGGSSLEVHDNVHNAGTQTSTEQPSVNAMKLESIALSLNRHLSLLMKAVILKENENEALKGELSHTKDQLQLLRRESRSPAISRPNSFEPQLTSAEVATAETVFLEPEDRSDIYRSSSRSGSLVSDTSEKKEDL